MRRLLLAVGCLLLLTGAAAAAYETYGGQDAYGLQSRKSRTSTAIAPYYYWAWTISPAGVQGASVTNAGRYQVHHRMIVESTYIPIARIDLLHTNSTAADTIAFKVYNGAVADSMVWISAAVNDVSFPVIGDSVAFKPYKASAAGDWHIRTYFER